MTSLTSVVVAGGNAAAAVARVEMLNPAGFAGLAVSSGLDVQGYVTDRQPDLVLLEGPFDDVDAFEVVRKLKSEADTLHIPVIMLNTPASAEKHRDGLESGLSDMIAENTPDDIILARLRPYIRLSTMHAECLRRVTTARDFRIDIPMDGVHEVDTANCRVLFVGGQSDAVAATAAALQETEFEITTESVHITAGERLARETFDAAVIAVDHNESPQNAYFLCSHIRDNSRLFNLPVLVVSGNQAELEDDGPYRRGASVALPLNSDVEDLATALRFLVRRQRLRWNLHGPLTATLQKNSQDSLAGLYSESFLQAHLDRNLERYTRRRHAFSIAVFAIQNVPGVTEQFGEGAAQKLMQRVADRISGMVRVEDTAARLGPFEICTVFPDSDEQDARKARDRIAGVLEQVEIELGDSQATNVWMQSGVTSATHGDTVDDLISRARDKFS